MPATILCAINIVDPFTLMRTLIPIFHRASKGGGSRRQSGELISEAQPLATQLQGVPGSGSSGSWKQHS